MKISTSLKSLVLVSGLLMSSLSFAGVTTSTNDNDVILSGYDTVSYFTKGTPTQGVANISSVYNDAIYHFSSVENRDAFKANPAKYAPQYGGFCAFGATISQKIAIDPTKFEIIDDKLYVQSSAKALELFQPEKAEKISLANKNWEEIKDTPASDL